MLTWPDVVLGLFDYPGLNSVFILLPRQVVRAAEEERGSWHLEHDTDKLFTEKCKEMYGSHRFD